MVERVIVSTDDGDIAEVAKSFGADIPFIRPAAISQDETTDLPVFEHVYEFLKSELSLEDLFVQLRPTTPVRPPGLIDAALNEFIDSGADSLRSISIAEPTPYKMWKKSGDLITPLLDIGIHESYNLPRQELPKAYWHNGLIDIFPVKTIIDQKSLTGEKVLPFEIDRKYCFDLDTELQWQYAEYMYEKMFENNQK